MITNQNGLQYNNLCKTKTFKTKKEPPQQENYKFKRNKTQGPAINQNDSI